MANDKAEKVYEQVAIIKKAEAELERLLGDGPRRGRPPKPEEQQQGSAGH